VHEARLGLPEQPSFLFARKGGPPAQPANMTSSGGAAFGGLTVAKDGRQRIAWLGILCLNDSSVSADPPARQLCG
jgi:hypothetical protein